MSQASNSDIDVQIDLACLPFGLADVWNQCHLPNWDGDGAEPVPADALRNTYRLIKTLPAEYPLPSIAAEPDGHVCLEWYRATNWLLSVSVSSEGILYYAALLGEDDPRGRCRFESEIPQAILCLIRRFHNSDKFQCPAAGLGGV